MNANVFKTQVETDKSIPIFKLVNQIERQIDRYLSIYQYISSNQLIAIFQQITLCLFTLQKNKQLPVKVIINESMKLVQSKQNLSKLHRPSIYLSTYLINKQFNQQQNQNAFKFHMIYCQLFGFLK
ncbi:hypothetical protein ABPG72_006478 [Tetrahymena utriculariae]